MSDSKSHWEDVYTSKKSDAVSWYSPHLATSIGLIERARLGVDASIIDVGSGASTLADDLLERGFSRLTLLDLSAAALAVTRERLATNGKSVEWIEGDATCVALPAAAYDLWHDRAVFHFLVERESRARYVAQVRRALKPGGCLVMATFGLNGPPRCSGLDVARYSPESLGAELGISFTLEESLTEEHRTPWGAIQEFVACRWRRADTPST